MLSLKQDIWLLIAEAEVSSHHVHNDLVYGNWLEFGVSSKVPCSLILSVFPCHHHLRVFPPTQLDVLISGVLLNNIQQL